MGRKSRADRLPTIEEHEDVPRQRITADVLADGAGEPVELSPHMDRLQRDVQPHAQRAPPASASTRRTGSAASNLAVTRTEGGLGWLVKRDGRHEPKSPLGRGLGRGHARPLKGPVPRDAAPTPHRGRPGVRPRAGGCWTVLWSRAILKRRCGRAPAATPATRGRHEQRRRCHFTTSTRSATA